MSETIFSVLAFFGIIAIFLIGVIFGGMILISGIKKIWTFLFK